MGFVIQLWQLAKPPEGRYKGGIAIAFILLAQCLCGRVKGDEHQDRYQELRRRLNAHVNLTLPGAAEYRFFLPGTQISASTENERKIFNSYAEALIRLAKRAVSEKPAWSYALLHEAAYFGEENLADKVVASKAVAPSARLASSNHPRLGWKRRTYFRVTSPHYQVVTRDKKAGIEVAQRLEMLYAVWRQVFFDFWSNDKKLSSSLKNEKKLTPSLRLHRVVLFGGKEEYVRYLQKSQPRIEITRGFYDLVARSSYFFPSDDVESTQVHEATHQLFQELGRASERLGLEQNFWAAEGIAMYMESLKRHGSVAILGGPGAHRLQFARYRRLREDFYIPLSDLVTFGRPKLQADPNIGQIYSQSAGLTHFFMDAADRGMRKGLVQYLKAIYSGRDRVDSLASALNADLTELDKEYAEFLQIDDEALMAAKIPKDHLRSLCLSGTKVSSRGLRALTPQSDLQWLDVAGLDVDDGSLSFLSAASMLNQVSFDHCSGITDRVFDLLRKNLTLDELDLSATSITDQGLEQLAGHRNLRTLWISNTAVSDAAIPTLVSFPSLKMLDCVGTQISVKGLQKLKQKRPEIELRHD